MDIKINFSVEGLSDLLKKFEALKNIEKDPRVDKALGKGAARIQAAVKMITPVDSSNLVNKIVLAHNKMMEYAVTTNVEYAVYVEYGTGRLGDPTVPHTSKDHWTYYSEKLQKYITTHGQAPAHMFTKGFASAHQKAFEIVRKDIMEVIKNA
ncbi:MAG: HK97 gp10 family phage protein [Ruminococcus sp.]|nr:HK97 gp10 family phage protein [Ruminococcus sp.]